MTEIEQKALALVNGVRLEDCCDPLSLGVIENNYGFIALCRAIEQHEQFKREVSDVAEGILNCTNINKRYGACLTLNRFILPKPVDPLVEACTEAHGHGYHDTEAAFADQLRAALAKRGGKIVWENEP